MYTISDFIKIPKIDSCKHLSTGMRYSSLVQWTGFLIPGFTEFKTDKAGSEDDFKRRKEVADFARQRIASAHDILLLLCYSISESVQENIKVLNGTINVDFLSLCKSATEFLDIIKSASEKYADKTKVRPFLGINSDKENNLHLADMILDSGLFAGIELAGERFIQEPEKFLTIFNTARKMGIEARIACLGFRNSDDEKYILEIVQNLKPSTLLNPNITSKKIQSALIYDKKRMESTIKSLKSSGVKIDFSPAPLLSGDKETEKLQIIRSFVDADIPVHFCTEDVLYLNKSISEFAADLCNSGLFSKEEVEALIKA